MVPTVRLPVIDVIVPVTIKLDRLEKADAVTVAEAVTCDVTVERFAIIALTLPAEITPVMEALLATDSEDVFKMLALRVPPILAYAPVTLSTDDDMLPDATIFPVTLAAVATNKLLILEYGPVTFNTLELIVLVALRLPAILAAVETYKLLILAYGPVTLSAADVIVPEEVRLPAILAAVEIYKLLMLAVVPEELKYVRVPAMFSVVLLTVLITALPATARF